MRLFTAVELPTSVRAAVAAAAAPLLEGLEEARSVEPVNLHVTVRFLGDVPPSGLPALRAALAGASAASPAGTARVRGFGAFPSTRAPRVVWAGVDDPESSIAGLERAVTERIAPLGHPPEDRPYAPHVTVGRVHGQRGSRAPYRGRGRPPRGATRHAFEPPPPVAIGPEFPVRELTLFESELTPRGARYREIGRFPLAPAPKRDPTTAPRLTPTDAHP